jgi:hypothetical protein
VDIVVSDGRRQVAVACDGDRVRPLETIDDDLAAQAVLERVGWRFAHVRATRFCRDPEGTIVALARELRRLGVEPGVRPTSDPGGENLRNKVIRRAWQIMREQDWVADPAAPAPEPAASAEAGGVVAELILDDTTEPHFVIVEQTVTDALDEATPTAPLEDTTTGEVPTRPR